MVISIVNNYIMYQRKVEILKCPKNQVNKLNLPDNTEFKNVIFFYKKNKYDKCYKNDLKNNINSNELKRYKGQMVIEDTLDMIKRKNSNNIYFIENDDNSSRINLTDENILGIKYLPE